MAVGKLCVKIELLIYFDLSIFKYDVTQTIASQFQDQMSTKKFPRYMVFINVLYNICIIHTIIINNILNYIKR